MGYLTCPYLKVPHLLLCYTLERPVLASRQGGGAEVKVGVAMTHRVLKTKERGPRVLGTPLQGPL